MNIDELINLRNDIIFKIVFGYQKNEKILISFLNAILDLENNHKIVSLTFLNTINIKEYINDKLTTLDVKVIDGNNKIYNIEMQVEDKRDYLKRINYYLDKLYTSQLKSGEPYDTLSKTISISILDYLYLEEEVDIHNIYRYLNIRSKKELTDLKEIHFIELPKFIEKSAENLNTRFEKWLYALKYGENHVYDLDNIPSKLKEEEEIVMALNEMLKASRDDSVRELLEVKEKARHDEISKLHNAKLEGKIEGEQTGIAKGKIEGEQIGIAKGKIEGEQIGIAKGKIEGEQIGIAKGEQIGVFKAKKELVINLLTKKFGALPENIIKMLNNNTNIDFFQNIIDNIFDLNTLDELFKID
ncbi:MAG: Rpn family recombination-promoting nuclease/putative transposase [Candidatus Sericytochromatia bacterium]